MGDLNAKIVQREVTGSIGKFGLGLRNERGDRLVEFCERADMIITFYQTWSIPAQNSDGKNSNMHLKTVNPERQQDLTKCLLTY
ncbi:hypothetical protein HUJ05_003358 [Dendroctonus ponderosae]|nr:hypothetical protein HUJ05_003358 [Dendroctonus ponderosae]